MPWSVYILADPTSGRVRYIGCSSHPLHRFTAHKSVARQGGKQPVNKWIQHLAQFGLAPVFRVVKEFSAAEKLAALSLEKYLIAQNSSRYLLNVQNNKELDEKYCGVA